jgi:hypothetical protein
LPFHFGQQQAFQKGFNMRISRRSFVTSGALIAAASYPTFSRAQDNQIVSETDPAAKALAFHSDASTVDKTKFAQYAVGQSCASCSFYEGTAGASEGVCQMYSGKRVPSKAWCAVYFKRP